MSSQFRPTRPDDAGGIVEFMQRVFGMHRDHPSFRPDQMHWKYWREHPDWQGSRGYLLERDGHIAAHGSVVPLTCLWGVRRLKMADVIDWAALPGNPGAGIALLKNIGKLVDGIFIAGGTEAAQKVFQSLGFRDCEPAETFALPLRPVARFIEDSEPMWKRAARLARNSIWAAQSPGFTSSNWTARKIAPDEHPFPTPTPRAQEAVFERTPEAIALLLDCPAAPGEFYLLEKGNGSAGYFILTQAVSQCRIADSWVEPGRPEDWRALYRLAVAAARKHPNSTEIVTIVSNDEAAREGLLQAGFRHRGTGSLRVFIPGGECPRNMRYQMMDNDNAWLHDGTTSYRT